MNTELVNEVINSEIFNTLIWLKDFPEYKETFEQVLKDNNIPHCADTFDNFGLRFDLDYLNTIGLSLIHYPVEYMAEYVDVITKTKIDDNDQEFIRVQLLDHEYDYKPKYNTWNAASIGNLAYCAINCKDEKAREIAIKKLAGCMKYYNKEVFPGVIQKLSNRNKA